MLIVLVLIHTYLRNIPENIKMCFSRSFGRFLTFLYPVNVKDKNIYDRLKNIINRKRIYVYHPHSIVPVTFSHFMTNSIPCVVDYRLLQPPCPIVCCLTVYPNVRYEMDRILSLYGSIVISVGGVEEMFLHDNTDTLRVWIKNRHGLFRFANQHDAIIIPCITPDEDKHYVSNNFKNKQSLMNLYRITGIALSVFDVFTNGFPLLPVSCTVDMYIAEPIDTRDYKKCNRKTKIIQKDYISNIIKKCQNENIIYEIY